MHLIIFYHAVCISDQHLSIVSSHLQEPWLICLVALHVLLLLSAILSRKHINLQMCLFLLACRFPTLVLVLILVLHYSKKFSFCCAVSIISIF